MWRFELPIAINLLWGLWNIYFTVVNRRRALMVDKILTERLSELNKIRVSELNRIPVPEFRVCQTCNRIVEGPCPKCQAVLSN